MITRLNAIGFFFQNEQRSFQPKYDNVVLIINCNAACSERALETMS